MRMRKRDASREGGKAMQCVYPSCWVQLQSEPQRHRNEWHIHSSKGHVKGSERNCVLKLLTEERMKEEFLCPSHFHHPFSFGQNFPHWVLPPPISGPLVSERPEHMPWDTASKSQKRGKLVWVESWSRDRGGSWKALKKCTILCPSTVRIWGTRTPWGSLVPGQGGIFLRSLKSHHLEDCQFYKTERQVSRFSEPGGEAKTRVEKK